MCLSIDNLSVLWGEILRGRSYVVWRGESFVFSFVYGENCAFNLVSTLCLYWLSSAETKSTMTPPQAPAREQTSKQLVRLLCLH